MSRPAHLHPRNTAPSSAQSLVLAHLRAFGPATCTELTADLPKGREAIRSALARLYSARLIYIQSWPFLGMQRAAQWAIRTHSSQSDAPKPPARDPQQLRIEWGRRNKSLLKARRSIHAARGNPFAMLIS